MTDADRIAALERELSDTRHAAVAMMLGMARGMVSTPEGREELARGFDEAAVGADPVTAKLARAVADAIRRG